MTYCSANVRLLPKADIRRRDLRFENWHRFFKPSQRSVACAGEISSKSLPDQRLWQVHHNWENSHVGSPLRPPSVTIMSAPTSGTSMGTD